MTEPEPYQFVSNNNIEWHFTNDNDDIILFVNNYIIEDWNKLLGPGITDEDGLECVMKDGYFCFYMKTIFEYFGIEINNVFKPE